MQQATFSLFRKGREGPHQKLFAKARRFPNFPRSNHQISFICRVKKKKKKNMLYNTCMCTCTYIHCYRLDAKRKNGRQKWRKVWSRKGWCNSQLNLSAKAQRILNFFNFFFWVVWRLQLLQLHNSIFAYINFFSFLSQTYSPGHSVVQPNYAWCIYCIVLYILDLVHVHVHCTYGSSM